MGYVVPIRVRCRKALALRPSVGMRVLRMDRLEQQVGELTQAYKATRADRFNTERERQWRTRNRQGVMATTKFHNLMVVGLIVDLLKAMHPI